MSIRKGSNPASPAIPQSAGSTTRRHRGYMWTMVLVSSGTWCGPNRRCIDQVVVYRCEPARRKRAVAMPSAQGSVDLGDLASGTRTRLFGSRRYATQKRSGSVRSV